LIDSVSLSFFLFLTSNLSHLFSELFLLSFSSLQFSLSHVYTHSLTLLCIVCCVEYTHRILECHECSRKQMKERYVNY
jgi:hypothetical protein